MKPAGVRVSVFVAVLIAALSFSQIGLAQNVSLTFEQAEFRHVFQTLGDIAGYNVLVDPSVTGTGSFNLQDVSVTEALDLVAGLSGYSYRMVGETLLVAAKERLVEFEGNQIRYFQLKYAKAEVAANALGILLSSDSMYIQPDTGLVVLRGNPGVLAEAEQILQVIDQPGKISVDTREKSLLDIFQQLSEELQLNLIADPRLEDRYLFLNLRQENPADVIQHIRSVANLDIVIADDTMVVTIPTDEEVRVDAPKQQVKVYRLQHGDPEIVGNILGMVIDASRIQQDPAGKAVTVRATDEELLEIDEVIREYDRALPQVLLEVWVQEMSTDAQQVLGMDWKGVPNFSGDPTVPTFLELQWQPWELLLALKALEEQGMATLLASPKIATLSGLEASIFVGDRVPIVLTDADGTRTLEFLESGIDLRVTPRVSEDDYITINVRPEVSTFIWQPGIQYPSIRTREAETTVRVKDGQPIVIGGLLQEQETELISKIPFISDLPILGRLFQWKDTKTEQTEMVIFMVPKIIDGSEGVINDSFFTETQ